MYLKMMNKKCSSIKKIGKEINKTFIDVSNFNKEEFNSFLSNKENDYEILLANKILINKIFNENVKIFLLESDNKKYLIADKYSIYDRVYLLDDEGQTIERLI